MTAAHAIVLAEALRPEPSDEELRREPTFVKLPRSALEEFVRAQREKQEKRDDG